MECTDLVFVDDEDAWDYDEQYAPDGQPRTKEE